MRERPRSKLSGFRNVISGCHLRNPRHHFQLGPEVWLNRDFLSLLRTMAQAKALIWETDKG